MLLLLILGKSAARTEPNRIGNWNRSWCEVEAGAASGCQCSCTVLKIRCGSLGPYTHTPTHPHTHQQSQLTVETFGRIRKQSIDYKEKWSGTERKRVCDAMQNNLAAGCGQWKQSLVPKWMDWSSLSLFRYSLWHSPRSKHQSVPSKPLHSVSIALGVLLHSIDTMCKEGSFRPFVIYVSPSIIADTNY